MKNITRDEEFRPIPGYPRYEISDHGRVRNTKTGRTWEGSATEDGYRMLYLPRIYTEGSFTRPKLRIHRIVAEVFIGPATGPLVRHLDDNRSNNHVSNLAYGTDADNSRDRGANGHTYNGRAARTHCPYGHEYTPENTWRGSKNERRCYLCMQAGWRAYKAKKKNLRQS